jgi:hypothetical protein
MQKAAPHLIVFAAIPLGHVLQALTKAELKEFRRLVKKPTQSEDR